MGELPSHSQSEQGGPIQPSFNRSIHIEARPTHLSSDPGALVLRQLLDHSQVLNWVDAHFEDLRTQDQITHPLPELLRTQIVLLAQGWTHADDADALREDPVLRLAVSDRKGQAPLRTPDGNRPQGLASQPTLSRLLEQASTAYNRPLKKSDFLKNTHRDCLSNQPFLDLENTKEKGRCPEEVGDVDEQASRKSAARNVGAEQHPVRGAGSSVLHSTQPAAGRA